jgi:hypothetical protein
VSHHNLCSREAAFYVDNTLGMDFTNTQEQKSYCIMMFQVCSQQLISIIQQKQIVEKVEYSSFFSELKKPIN